MTGRRDLVIGTAGHIDHGKTALVRALTGVDTDRLPAEKQRGITIDLGFAALDLGDLRLSLVDVPGHEKFIRNMLAGASGLDLALLIVAADDSVMPQTLEHLQILQILGLAGGVIALTKVDLVDASWLDLVEEEVRALVAGTFLADAEIVRTSAPSGIGIDELRASLARLADSASIRDDPGLFRLSIDRSFTLAGHGTVVTGTVASGEVAVGDELTLWPEGRTVRVRGVHRHDRAIERVGRGTRAAINLNGVHHSEVRRGHELASPGYLQASKLLSVELSGTIEAARPLRHRGRYRVHLGTSEVSASLSLRGSSEDAPNRIAQLFLAEPVVSVHGQPFVIREESPPATLGGGRVLHPTAARRIRKRDRLEVDRLQRLAMSDPRERILASLASFGLGAWTPEGLVRDSGVPVETARRIVDSLRTDGSVIALPIGPKRVAHVLSEVAEALESRVLKAVARLHEATPRQSSIARAKVLSSLADLENEPLVSSLIDRLGNAGRLIADPRSVALVGHEPKLSQAERKLKRELAEAFNVGGFSPPDPSDWVAKTGPRSSTVPDLLQLLVDEERIVVVGSGLYLDREAEAEMRRKVAEELSQGPGLTMAGLRDLLGTSRKFAVPLGEYLDRIGWTTRDGDQRILGPASQVVEPSAGGVLS